MCTCLQGPAQSPTQGMRSLAGEQVSPDPLCGEAGLAADVSVSPDGQQESNVSKPESAQGSAMGITIMMAMITIM